MCLIARIICLKEYKSIIITLSVIALITAGIVNYVKDLIDEPFDIEIPKEFIYNGAKIALAWTDDNTGENLIIQSDKKEYSGFNKVDVYFSITNISNKNQEMDVVIWLEDGERSVERIEKLDGDNQSSLNILQYSPVIPSLTGNPGGSGKNDDSKKTVENNSNSFGSLLDSRFRGNDKGESGNDKEGAAQDDLNTDSQNGSTALRDYGAGDARKDIKGFTNGYAVNDEIESGQTNFYKATIKYPTLSKGEFFIEAFGKSNSKFKIQNSEFAYGHLDPWYSSSWTYKRAITLQGSKIATTTTAFPVLATTTLADLKTTTNGGKVGNDNGYDIIFVDSDDSTLLNYEREKYASTTGEIAYWIKTDIASSTDKTIYMYYGNAGASDTATTTGVWDDNFVMVNHLAHNNIATTTYPDFKDSTKYANNGSSVNMNAADLVNGQVDGALDFDGVNDYVNVADNADSIENSYHKGNSNFTVSMIYAPHQVASPSDVKSYGLFGSIYILGDEINFFHKNNWGWNTIELQVLDGWAAKTLKTNTLSLTVNVPIFLSLVWDGTTAMIYKDNVLATSTPIAQASFSDGAITNAFLGSFRSSYALNYGLIDEARVSNTARTAGWITTEWNNQSSVGSFMTIGAEISSWPAVTTNAVTKIASTVATANGNITNIGSGAVSARGFKYGLSEVDTWTVSETGSFSAGVFKLDAPNLTPGTTYYIRAYATNSEGTGYGSYVSFVTLTEQTGSPIIFKKNIILKENVILK
ncbi:MAG: DUF2341 domain-containing protein [bacterium]|nr:DUF2341 domain-containing protein [bacterium]